MAGIFSSTFVCTIGLSWYNAWMKICTKCKEPHPLTNFYRAKKSPDGLTYWCRQCLSRLSMESQKRRREKIGQKAWALQLRKADLKQYYGLSLEAFDAMVKGQKGKCAICWQKPKKGLVVDHCHKTGIVRGLLCGNCNVGIGNLRDDPEIVASALAYLSR